MSEESSEHNTTMPAVIVDTTDVDETGGNEEVMASVELNGDAMNLNYQRLRVLPNRLFDVDVCDFLHRLYLKNNLLQSLSPEVKRFQHLREIYLHGNQLRILPEEICELPHLETLGVGNNQLTSLPRSISRLRSLRRLHLGGNQFRQLPAELGQLGQLQILEANCNQLRRLPFQLGQCQSLTQLCVDSNQLSELPRQLCHLTQLTLLSACNNFLVSLPQDLGRIPALQFVYVDNNPSLMALPSSILQKTIGFCRSGTSVTTEHLLSLQQCVILGTSEDDAIIVPLPSEISCVGHMHTNRVPTLLELSLRVTYKLVENSVVGQLEGEVPSDLLSLLQMPTAHCQQCDTEIFLSAFPAIFRMHVQACNPLQLALCCSSSCVRQCSLRVNLPLLYPRLEDLALALVLV